MSHSTLENAILFTIDEIIFLSLNTESRWEFRILSKQLIHACKYLGVMIGSVAPKFGKARGIVR